MAVLLLQLIFSAITILSNLVSRLLFTVTAYLLVLIIQACKVPGEALQGALEQVAGFIKTCIEYFLELALEVISTIVSTFFDLVKEGVFGSVEAAGAAVGGLAEKMKSSLDGLIEGVPEVLEGFAEMVTTMVSDLWNNYMDAKSYVTENA